jgi:DNA invertase Pin-like site-specific DNA recombinase
MIGLQEPLCGERGYEVVGIFSDHGKSAFKVSLRPEYQKVMKLVKQRRIQHVIVWALDRWCRRGAKELKTTIDLLAVYDVQLHSVQEQWLETINIPGGIGDVVKDFLIGIVGWIAHQESLLKSERIKGSIKFKRALEKGRVGRPSLPNDVITQVVDALRHGDSYRKIQREVTYKIKHGKIKHISQATVCKIAKQYA